jgi:hypothetical protein
MLIINTLVTADILSYPAAFLAINLRALDGEKELDDINVTIDNSKM